MTYLYASIFGLVQGVAEFFPISSSGHLLILHYLFPVFESTSVALSFDVALHVSVLCILVIFYWKNLVQYIGSALRRDAHPHTHVFWYLVIGTIPALFVGYFFESIIETRARSLLVVGTALIVGGVLFFIVERWGTQERSFEELTPGKALLIGCGQALALIPGMSRSGMIIIASMALGLKREAATNFAFLLGIPVFFLAGARRLFVLLGQGGIAAGDVGLFVVGFLVAGAVGACSIRFLLRYVKTRSFIPFGVYRIVLGAALLLMLFLQK